MNPYAFAFILVLIVAVLVINIVFNDKLKKKDKSMELELKEYEEEMAKLREKDLTLEKLLTSSKSYDQEIARLREKDLSLESRLTGSKSYDQEIARLRAKDSLLESRLVRSYDQEIARLREKDLSLESRLTGSKSYDQEIARLQERDLSFERQLASLKPQEIKVNSFVSYQYITSLSDLGAHYLNRSSTEGNPNSIAVAYGIVLNIGPVQTRGNNFVHYAEVAWNTIHILTSRDPQKLLIEWKLSPTNKDWNEKYFGLVFGDYSSPPTVNTELPIIIPLHHLELVVPIRRNISDIKSVRYDFEFKGINRPDKPIPAQPARAIGIIRNVIIDGSEEIAEVIWNRIMSRTTFQTLFERSEGNEIYNAELFGTIQDGKLIPPTKIPELPVEMPMSVLNIKY